LSILLTKGRKKLKIAVGRHSGFCFGVKRAYDLACVNSKDCDRLYILGKLVHNSDVCEDLEKKGIIEIKSLREAKEGTIISTAHGIGPSLYKEASKRGLKIIDTTCPKVMKAQRLAKNYSEKGHTVIIFGDKNHQEVKSIREWSECKANIICGLAEAKKIKIDQKKKYCLISQTTQNVCEFKNISSFLRKSAKNFIYFNTICDSTDDRQGEIRELAKKNNAVLVIGGRDSANSKRLYEIAKEINKNSHFIESEKQLKKSWLADAKKIAVSAGASTPEWMIRRVVDKIRKIT
jgi:4-hydroxy-3-methylbut-2-enyl diphosphate reductase